MNFEYNLQPSVSVKVQEKVIFSATQTLQPLVTEIKVREITRTSFSYNLLPTSTRETPNLFYGEELFSLAEALKATAIGQEEISLTDKIKLALPSEVSQLSEIAFLSDIPYFAYVYKERVGLLDLLKTQQIIPGAYRLNGYVYQSASPEEPLADATVHIISIEPRQNIAFTHTDSEGYYEFHNISKGTYLLMAVKEGYTAHIARIEIEGDCFQNFIVYPITVWCFIERICSPYGHVVKIYGIDDKVENGVRTVTALLLFGDIYGKCTKGLSSVIGGMAPLESATISLIDFPGLDKKGLFEQNELIFEKDGNIYFACDISPGDFEAFAFTISGPPDKDLRFRFFLKLKEVPGPPGAPSYQSEHSADDIKPPSDGGRIYYSSTGAGAAGNYSKGSGGWSFAGSGGCGGPGCTGGPGGGAKKGDTSTFQKTPEGTTLYTKDTLSLNFAFEAYKIPTLFLADYLNTTDKVEFPPPITIIGRTYDIYGEPASGVTVIAVEKETGRLISQTKSGDDGFYMIQVPSELEYIIYWTAPGYYTVKGYVLAGNKDIIDDRARIDAESSILLLSGSTFYYETVFVFWALEPSEGGKIYGYVYDSETKEPIPNAIIYINDGEFIAVTDENGYFEQIVPRGHYTLYVVAPGYKPSEVYEGDIYSNWRQDIYLDPAEMTVYVYDALDSDPELKPIPNAKITTSVDTYYTDEEGKAYIRITPGETITIEKEDYKTLRIKAREGEKRVFMHPVYAYTIHLSERVELS